VEGRGRRVIVIVDPDKCVNCGACVDACPEHAIAMDMAIAIDPGRCTGCGACVPECPSGALRLGPPPPA
jgi:NAD-dependent dihydropyrimidine dehydrogenase PreA subunit